METKGYRTYQMHQAMDHKGTKKFAGVLNTDRIEEPRVVTHTAYSGAKVWGVPYARNKEILDNMTKELRSKVRDWKKEGYKEYGVPWVTR